MRVNLFSYAVLAVAGFQGYVNAQTTQWQPSPSIQRVGFVQQEDKPDVEALQATIEKLELRLREVEDDVQERLESTDCLLYTSPSPRDGLLSRMPSSA